MNIPANKLKFNSSQYIHIFNNEGELQKFLNIKKGKVILFANRNDFIIQSQKYLPTLQPGEVPSVGIIRLISALSDKIHMRYDHIKYVVLTR